MTVCSEAITGIISESCHLQVLNAAFEAFESDGNIDELVETLCMLSEHSVGSSPRSRQSPPRTRSPIMARDPPEVSLFSGISWGSCCCTGSDCVLCDQVDKAFIAICRSLYESGSVRADEAHGLVELMHARDPRILAARDVRLVQLFVCCQCCELVSL